MPDLSKFKGNDHSNGILTQAWRNRVFGGSVLKPLGSHNKAKRTRTNPLHDHIQEMKIDEEKGGGYYILPNIQMYEGNNIHFCDIYIVTEELSDENYQGQFQAASEDHVNLAKYATQKEMKAFKILPPKLKLKEQLYFQDIKPELNGICRIINYEKTSENKFSVRSLEEGEFQGGEKHGYCRCISSIDGSCSAGFHCNGIPQGKWTLYDINGEFAKPEGLYDGEECEHKMKISHFN